MFNVMGGVSGAEIMFKVMGGVSAMSKVMAGGGASAMFKPMGGGEGRQPCSM